MLLFRLNTVNKILQFNKYILVIYFSLPLFEKSGKTSFDFQLEV